MIASQDGTAGGEAHRRGPSGTGRPVTVRAYLPTTLGLLREARVRGGFGPGPLAAHAVTPALQALGQGVGEEELEWAASVSASLDSLRLLAGERGDDQPRRVVAAVDVTAFREVAESTGDAGAESAPSAVVLPEVPLRRLAALLVDGADAEPVVRAARDALTGGAAEDDPAVERCLDQELGWWAASELDTLLGD
jgi:hypothetical protein